MSLFFLLNFIIFGQVQLLEMGLSELQLFDNVSEVWILGELSQVALVFFLFDG